MKRHGAARAAVLLALVLLCVSSAAPSAAVEPPQLPVPLPPQPIPGRGDAVPVPHPGPRDGGRTVPIAAFLRAETDFAEGRKEAALKGFLDIAYTGPEDERMGFVWMRVGRILLERGELDKALEAADKAVRLSRARYLSLSAMDLKLAIYEKMDWAGEARQVAGYLIDQRYVDANVPVLLALMARADARAGKIGSALALYRRAVAASPAPEDTARLMSERGSLIDRTTDISGLREAADAEDDPEVRGQLFLSLGRAAAKKGFYGMARYAFDRSALAGGRRSSEAAEGLFRIERISAGRPTIVGLVPLSGKMADLGFAVLAGAEVALAPGRFNVPGALTPVIRWVDTAGDPGRARAEFTAAAADRAVVGFVGPLTGDEGHSVSAAFGPKSPPVLYLGQKAILEKPFLYGFGLSPIEEARAVLGLFGREKRDDLLLLYPENGYGRGFADAVAKSSADAGVRIVKTIGYAPESRDFTGVIRRAVGDARFLKESRTKEKGKAMDLPLDGIVIADRWDRVFLLASQLNYYNVYLPLAGFSGWYSEELLRRAGSAVSGAVFSVDYSDAIPGSQGDRFRKEYQEAMHSAPSRFEAMGYDGALLLAEASLVEGGEGKPLGEAMRDRIPRLKNFLGVTGAFQFTPSGEMRRKVPLLRIDLGNFVPVPWP